MQVGLDGPEGSAGQRGDLVERAFREETQGNDLPIRLRQASNRVANGYLTLAAQDQAFGIGRSVGSEAGDRILERAFGGDAWTDPRNGLPARCLADRQTHGDPCKPGSERTVPTPRAERPVGGHERLLGDIFGFPEITEDPVARSDDRGRFAVHEGPKSVPITTENCPDNCGVISEWLQGLRCGCREIDRSTP